jgi:hypothetical protein
MESIPSSQRTLFGLPVIADMLNHRREIGLQACEKLGYLVQAPFDRVEAGGSRFATACDWLTRRRRPVAPQHRFEVLRLPAECHRKRFQGSSATAALNGVTLNLSHNRRRHMRALYEFALTPSKLIHALIDDFGNCRPILRHPFPPRSAFGAEAIRSRSFRGPARGFSRRYLACTSAGSAEIIEISLKSAMTARTTGFRAVDERKIP